MDCVVWERRVAASEAKSCLLIALSLGDRTFFPESRWEVERTQDGVMVRFKLVGNLCGRDNFVRISTDEPVQDVARSVCWFRNELCEVVIRE